MSGWLEVDDTLRREVRVKAPPRLRGEKKNGRESLDLLIVTEMCVTSVSFVYSA